MLIRDLYTGKKPLVSLEVFPPKKEDHVEEIYGALSEMAALSPDFISVTYGAGGGGNTEKTLEIAGEIQREHHVTALAHLTCIGAQKQDIARILESMWDSGIRNILALRGDLPEGRGEPDRRDYRYARDLIAEIKGGGRFCVGAACYPEGHIECDDLEDDTGHLREKQEAGADFLVSQLFFDNALFYRFLDRIRAGGVTLPVSAGVMPILGRQQIERMIFMCGASLPSAIIRLLHRYENSPQDLRKAGVEHAALQVRDLLDHGVDGVHIYSMNRPDIARTCMSQAGRR